MSEIKKVSFIGAGAIGCVYAGKLLTYLGRENLSLIASPDRKARYEKEGLILNGSPLAFHYVTPDEKVSPADLVIIAVKYHQLPQAIDSIKNHIGENTMILSLLNGISSERDIAKIYGKEKLLYSFAVGIDATRNGNSVVCGNPGKIVFGEQNNEKTDRVKAVEALFQASDINFSIPEDILHELWWKFLFNVGINSVSAILKAPYGVFQKIPEAVSCMTAAQEEVIAVANAEGIPLGSADIDRVLKLLPVFSPDGETSMLQDVKAKRKTEVEMFSGAVKALGEKHHIPTPVNSLILDMITVIEKTY